MRPLWLVWATVLLAATLAASEAPRIVARKVSVRPGETIQAPIPFRAVGVLWRGDASPRVRASVDGAAWTEWREARVENDLGDRFSSEVIFFGALLRNLEVESRASEVEVVFIDPGESPAEMRARRRTAAPTPVVIPREAWGCTPQTCPAKDPPAYTQVTHLIVHHTAGANTAADWPAVVRSIWALHVQGNGWNDIGYNYLVDPHGVLYEGRAGGDGVLGAHFSGVNSGTMGVSLMGSYSGVPPAGAASATLRDMLAWQAARWRLDPSGAGLHAASGLPLNTISGHRDAGLSPRATSRTECPGNALYVLLPRLRAEARKLVEGDYPIPEPAPRRCEIGTPCPAPGGIVNAAGFDSRPVVPGSLITIFGTGLAPDGAPAGTSVTVNGQAAPLLYASPTQINAQLPPGIATGTARAVVSVSGVAGPETYLWVTEAAPAIFTYGSGRAVAQNHDDGKLNAPDAPARPGSAVVVYLTSAGAVSGVFPEAGQPTGSDRLYPVRLPSSATLGGRPAGLLFLGLTPGFVGLYQANLVVPSGLSPGDHLLVITVSGAVSPPATITVAEDRSRIPSRLDPS